MAKQQRKHQIVKSAQGQGQMVEEVFDDNLLPDASEIEKLYKIDPQILNWLKQSAEKEQDFRHCAFNKKLELVEKTEKGDRRISSLGLIFSFIIVLAGMFFSGFLIYTNHEVLGSVFAGAILLAIVSAFLAKVTKQNNRIEH